LVISTGAREALNQQALSLRDKTLWAFDPAQVKSIQIRTDKTKVDLEKTGAAAWRWVGRADYKVRPDRVEELLRQLKQARIIDFPAAAPKDLRTAGLAPQAKTAITLVTAQGAETLSLGAGTGSEVYARLGPQGQVVKVGKELPEQLARSLANLEDRRLWSGPLKEVEVAGWGTPGQFWTAVRDKSGNFWKITGPDKVELKQTPPQVEKALINFQNLEYSSLLPKAGAPGKDAFAFELFAQDGQQMLHLDELAKTAGTVAVQIKSGKTTFAAAVPRQKYDQWRAEMDRLTTPPPKPAR